MNGMTIFALAAAATAPQVGQPGQVSIKPTLTEIREVRVATLVEPENKFTFPQNQPGLTMDFTLALPQGASLVEVSQPEKITATDSTDGDLTKIAENVFGNPEFVTKEHSWDGEPAKVSLHLAQPARAATTFGVSTSFEVVISTGTRDVEITAGKAWRPLEGDGIPAGTYQVRWNVNGDNVQLDVKPGDIRTFVEGLTLVTDGQEHDNQGSMWNDQEVSWFFPVPPAEGATVRLSIRTGVQTFAVPITLSNQPLP